MKRIDEIFNNAAYSEKAIERYLVKRVKELGGIALKFYSPSMTGYPDRIVMLPGGITVWCELKSRGEKPRATQIAAMRRLADIGQIVYVCDSRENVDKMLEGFTNEQR